MHKFLLHVESVESKAKNNIGINGVYVESVEMISTSIYNVCSNSKSLNYNILRIKALNYTPNFELQPLRIKLYVIGFELVKLRINRVRINSAF